MSEIEKPCYTLIGTNDAIFAFVLALTTIIVNYLVKSRCIRIKLCYDMVDIRRAVSKRLPSPSTTNDENSV